MKIPIRYLLLSLVVLALLVAGNVYQFQNPRIVSVPEYHQTPVDTTTWVLRSSYQKRGRIIDSLRSVSKNLADRVRSSHNQVASYTRILARLHTKMDSLKFGQPEKKVIQTTQGFFKDTTLRFSRTFGNHLFRVDSKVHLRGRQVWDDLSLHQLRDVKLNVVTTQEAHDRYVLTYVNSPDLESLHYKSVTNLKPEKRFPLFWIGLGSGLVISALTLK